MSENFNRKLRKIQNNRYIIIFKINVYSMLIPSVQMDPIQP